MKDFELSASIAEKAGYWTYGGAGSSLLAGLAKIDWAMWTGIAVAVIGLIVNIVFKVLTYKLDRRERMLRIKKLNGDCGERQQ